MKVLFEKIREARRDSGLTQKELSEKIDISLSTIKSIEAERNMDKENIRLICEGISVPFEQVYLEDFRDTHVISVVNNKGGCGKTSVCGSLAYVLAEMSYRVLLIDADAQRNLTSSYDMVKREAHFGRAIKTEEGLENDYIVPTTYENIDFVVADASMGTLDMDIFSKVYRENLVRRVLSGVVESGRYDFILIDTNPNLSLLNFNIVNASNSVIIPVQMASFDVEGIGTVVDFIEGVKQYNRSLSILGIVVNKYDIRNRSITEAAENQLLDIYGDLIFKTYIKTDVKIQNAQWENKPVFAMGSSRIVKEYRCLAKEVMDRCKVMNR